MPTSGYARLIARVGNFQCSLSSPKETSGRTEKKLTLRSQGSQSHLIFEEEQQEQEGHDCPHPLHGRSPRGFAISKFLFEKTLVVERFIIAVHPNAIITRFGGPTRFATGSALRTSQSFFGHLGTTMGAVTIDGRFSTHETIRHEPNAIHHSSHIRQQDRLDAHSWGPDSIARLGRVFDSDYGPESDLFHGKQT